MGLIQKLKSALGLDGAESPDSGTAAPRDVDVTVEREPSSESEDAVKGTETASTGGVERDEPGVGAGAGESTTEEPPIEEAEPDEDEPSVDESADDGTVQAETDGLAEESATEPSGDATDEEPVEGLDGAESVEDTDSTDAAGDASDLSDDPVTDISGIGPAYGQRLSDAGVDTVADLAGADPDELEAATDISAARIEGWIDAAAEY